MHLKIITFQIALANLIPAQIRAEILTPQNRLTATGATVLAIGATVTFTLDVTTATVSIGPGTTLTLNGSSPGGSATQNVPSPARGTSLPVVSTSPIGNSTCEVYADSDIIGLGVRLGLYFQASAFLEYPRRKRPTRSFRLIFS
jgi:hypothetical protein